MKEFGSDFHYCTEYVTDFTCVNTSKIVFYACGRHAINALIIQNGWKRIWIPTYFCYDVIESIKKTGITILFYNDSPIENDIDSIHKIRFMEGDVLFRINYFGLRLFRDNRAICVPVIEDHSHDLFGNWATNSNADWCIASLRKTIPISEGGVVWSPKKHNLVDPKPSKVNSALAQKRSQAMKLKSQYLSNEIISKEIFREIFLETENLFDKLPISSLDSESLNSIFSFDHRKWTIQKRKNWRALNDCQLKDVEVLTVEDSNRCNPFSWMLKFQSKEKRDEYRNLLIKNNVYPAILWEIPITQPQNTVLLSNTLLSIHCDGRYSDCDILELINIIKHL